MGELVKRWKGRSKLRWCAALALCGFAIFPTALLATEIHLSCDGTVDHIVDIDRKPSRQEHLDVTLDDDTMKLSVTGYWGCVTRECRVIEAFSDDHSVSAVVNTTVDGLMTQSALEINRDTGTLTTTSLHSAPAGGNYTWSIMLVAGTFQCKRAERLF
jgi:hypothetical protein